LSAELSSPKGVHIFWLAEGQTSPLYKLDLSPLNVVKHKVYATQKKMKLYFLEQSWPLFAGQRFQEFSCLNKRTSSKITSGESIWYGSLETAGSAMNWLRRWN